MITLTLPYPISANRYWRAVRLGKGPTARMAMVPTTEAKAYRDHVGHLAKAAGLKIPLDGRVTLLVRLYPDRPQDWAKRAQRDPDGWDDTVRCMDLGNCEKVLSDALNGIAWLDDKQLRRIVLERCEPDDRGARVEIEIDAVRRKMVAPSLFAEVA
jgi:crossover junction endodeoxyribonuclease RusA